MKETLKKLYDWARRMPDAGLTRDDPRWDWWHEGAQARVEAGYLLRVLSMVKDVEGFEGEPSPRAIVEHVRSECRRLMGTEAPWGEGPISLTGEGDPEAPREARWWVVHVVPGASEGWWLHVARVYGGWEDPGRKYEIVAMLKVLRRKEVEPALAFVQAALAPLTDNLLDH